MKGDRDRYSACLLCPIFRKSGQSIFVNSGEVNIIPFEDELAQKAKETGEFMAITDIPDQIKLIFVNYKFKVDARGNEALFVYYRTAQDERVVQKYTSTSYDEVLDAFKKAGGVDLLKVTLTTYEKRIVGRMQKPRLMPVQKPRKKKGEITQNET